MVSFFWVCFFLGVRVARFAWGVLFYLCHNAPYMSKFMIFTHVAIVVLGVEVRCLLSDTDTRYQMRGTHMTRMPIDRLSILHAVVDCTLFYVEFGNS
jgi:hypothetical protein